jgi:manganese-dependent inorganic pyrophosphatase
MKYIIGHKNPDTDATVSSLIYSDFLTKKNIKNTVIKLGNLNNETKFLLKKFNITEPATILELPKNSEIILMDHNETKQSINARERYKIWQIIDHHKFDFSTKEPLYIRSEPIGSSCSIVAKMFFEENFKLNQTQATLLISAIISDTLYFRSPTTTQEDHEITEKLNKIAKIEDLETWSLELFAAKSDLGDIPAKKLIQTDYKPFDFNGKKFAIGVMETTSPEYGLKRKTEIVEALQTIKKEDQLDGIFLSIIDILNEKNTTIFADDFTKETLIKAFDAKINGNLAELGNILSRKKQIVPKLETIF